MKKLLGALVLVAFAGTAFAANDVANTGSTPQYTPERILDQVGYIPLDLNAYSVGCGDDGMYLWVSAGDQATGACTFYLYDEYGNLIDEAPQGGGATGWGHRDMCHNGDYMFGSYGNLVDGFMDIYTFSGYFIGAPIPVNRAMAYAGGLFFTSGFGDPLYSMEWDGTWGSSATLTNLGGPWEAAYGLAYDCGWDCLWMTTASSSGYGVHQIGLDGFHINTYFDPLHPLYGGCTMTDTAQWGYVLCALVQESPDGLVFYDMESTGPSPVQDSSWGEIKGLFR
jgi:hypothetical protein